MSQRLPLPSALVAASIALACLSACGNQALMTRADRPALQIQAGAAAPRYTNRLVVRFREGAGESRLRAFEQRFKLTRVRRVAGLDLGVMALPSGQSAAGMLAAVQGHADVAYAEPDYLFQAPPAPRARARRVLLLAPLDLGRTWAARAIGLQAVTTFARAAAPQRVAILDTGIDLRHPALATRLAPGVSLVAGLAGPDDDHGHGTHVAGILASAAPNALIMPVKVLNREGKGDTGDIVSGIVWAVDNGARVINMSLGGTGGSRALADAVAYARRQDVVLVAAMGNSSANVQEFPAGYGGVIAVGATDEADAHADFSNTGPWISVAAPGADILSTLPTRTVTLNREEGKSLNYDRLDGTSMAAPYVAALASLVRGRFPAMDAPSVKARLERSADDLGEPGFDAEFGHGRINAAKALQGD